VGRECERRRIDALLDGARAGRGGTLVLSGAPGIGKTALLELAATHGGGMRTLRVRGVEAEPELVFAGLLELVTPVVGELDRLPVGQSAALARVIGVAPGPAVDRLAVYGATLGLLAALAEKQPLLVLVDDAQWLDRASLEALAFAAHRLQHDALAIIWSLRDGSAAELLLDGFDRIALAGLGEESARALLAAAHPGLAPNAARAIAVAVRGNPLALHEVPALLNEAQRAGVEPLLEPLPVSETLRRKFATQFAAQPATTREALLIAAIDDRDDVGSLAAALRARGLDLDALAPAEAAGLICIDGGRFEFRHPLVRAAVHASAPAAATRAAHRALAAALDGAGTEDRRCWHLALSLVEPDEAAAGALAALAERSRGHGWPAAAQAYERAAHLSPDASARAQRLVAGAEAFEMIGRRDRAAELLRAAGAATGDVRVRAHAMHLRAMLAASDDPPGALDELVRGAAAVESDDPERAAMMLVDAIDLLLVHPVLRGDTAEPVRRAEWIARRATRLAWPHGGRTEQLLRLRNGDVLGWLGKIEAAQAEWLLAAGIGVGDDAVGLTRVGEALFSAGEDARAREVLDRAVRLAREAGALSALPEAVSLLSLVDARTGDLSAAAAEAVEWADLSRALGLAGEEARALAQLAWVEGLRGREQVVRELVAEVAALHRTTGAAPPDTLPSGALELALGHWDAAVEQLEPLFVSRTRDAAADAIAPRTVAPLLIEAYVRAGRRAEAQPLLGSYIAAAERSGRDHVRALALRCRGVYAGDEEAFAAALELHSAGGNRYEAARTALAAGELLRRRRRRTEARVQLRAAVAGFEATGALAWAERAADELAASGERARRRSPSTADDLTPQELQVAGLVAQGLTNREVAEKLFLSPKTIESHLGRVFRKLGVHTRTQLAVAVGERRRQPAA
jgi:DNA-binding NarL/FixJ family response regulator